MSSKKAGSAIKADPMKAEDGLQEKGKDRLGPIAKRYVRVQRGWREPCRVYLDNELSVPFPVASDVFRAGHGATRTDEQIGISS